MIAREIGVVEEAERKAAAAALRELAQKLVDGFGYEEDHEAVVAAELMADGIWPGQVSQ